MKCTENGSKDIVKHLNKSITLCNARKLIVMSNLKGY